MNITRKWLRYTFILKLVINYRELLTVDLRGAWEMKKAELLLKSREAMLAAVQIYNNPLITFKTEGFIIQSIIAWTYLLHCYYANKGTDYRYSHIKANKKIFDRTKFGAFKHWELERCMDSEYCPIDQESKLNLEFLIGLRHEIEHQMTQNIDSSISAKIHACSINYNYYIKQLFGDRFGVDQQLGLAIQFSPIQPDQKDQLLNNNKVSANVQRFISIFENRLEEQKLIDPKYAYRILFTRLNANRKGMADQVVEFISEGTEGAEQLNKTYMLIKETEKKKYLAKEIIELMQKKGFRWFNTQIMTSYWQKELRSRDQFGIFITKGQWMWYENWIAVIEAFCLRESKKRTD